MLRTPRGAVLGTALVAALAVGMLQAPGQAVTQTPSAKPAYQNSKLPIQDRVADLDDA
jgi:hypothetical protein